MHFNLPGVARQRVTCDRISFGPFAQAPSGFGKTEILPSGIVAVGISWLMRRGELAALEVLASPLCKAEGSSTSSSLPSDPKVGNTLPHLHSGDFVW